MVRFPIVLYCMPGVQTNTMNRMLLIIVPVLFGCSGQMLEKHESPNGQYSLHVELGNRNNTKDKYILMFKLVDKEERELTYIRTGASHAMKWSVTWYNDKIIILDSSDIGAHAWKVGQDGKMTEVWPVTKDMINKGDEAFKKKYGR